MKHTITRAILKKAMESCGSLGSVPKIAVPVLTMFNDPNASFRDLTSVIESDNELAARILTIANSGYYGLQRKVDTVARAVILLGWNTVKMISLGSTILTHMNERNKRLYEHSMRTALFARFLAMEINFYKVEEIAVVGLLHDIGEFLLETLFPENTLIVKQHIIDSGVPSYIAEREILGVDHGQIGGWALEAWNLPKNISSSVMWHHDYKSKTYHARKTAVIHVADVLSLAADFTGPHWEKVPELNHMALKTLGFTELEFRDIVHGMLRVKLEPIIL